VAHNDAKIFGADAGAAAVGEVLKAEGLPDDRISVSIDALLVRTEGHVVLIDTGNGPKGHGVLPTSLGIAGITPDQVTDVLITHSHGDHVGGLLDEAGKSAFPNAKVRMSAAEWAWIRGKPESKELVHAIKAQVHTFKPGGVVVPGIRSVRLDGHTPGHVGYEVSSGKEKLLDIGDLAHSSIISLQKPDWAMGFDSDKKLGKVTRRATLAKLAAEREWVFAPHFPFPGVGHVVVDDGGFRWVEGIP
jgi:glyoxylase-like metal-dependent hydrolase (beta-lactamase superfamily II)